MEKKNTGLIVLVIVLALTVIGLGGYLVYDKVIKSDEEIQKDANETDNLKLDVAKDWIYGAEYEYNVSRESYSTGWKTYNVNDIRVPYLNINSTDAKNVNKELKNVFEQAIAIFKESASSSDPIKYVLCDYDYSIINNILSIAITYGEGATSYVVPKYYTYNFDLTTGELLSFVDIYTSLGYTDASVNSKIEDSIKSYIAEKHASFTQADYDLANTSLNEMNSATINNYKLSKSNNTIQYYIKSNNKLSVVVEYEWEMFDGNRNVMTDIN